MESNQRPEQSSQPMSTHEKFAAYEAANLAGGGTASHELWATFTPEERELWRQQAGALMPVPGGVQAKKVENKVG